MKFKNKLNKKKIGNYEIIYYDNDWQIPVITEKQIFDNFLKEEKIPFHYFAFPWASYIDNKWIKKYNILIEIIDEEINKHIVIDRNKTYFTVVQHIRFRELFDIYKKLNIKYIFTPHKISSDINFEEYYDIKIIPISLFPKQITKLHTPNNNRCYLTSFVGQYNHISFLSDIRKKIIENFEYKSDCLIIKKKNWHYNDIVYKNIDLKDNTNDDTYKQVLINSNFSLCPSGTGPNTIRLWESMCFGSIPVILADDLILPELPINYKDFLVFWNENDIEQLHSFLKKYKEKDILEMRKKCLEIYNEYFSPEMMHKSIVYFFEKNIEKIVLITQYYNVKNENNNYRLERQNEVDFCLLQNCNNPFIDQIHLLLDEEVDLSFLSETNLKKIKKKNIGKRLTYNYAFEYYNKYLSNTICILQNADIYIDQSIEIVKHINFDFKIFLALNRYESNNRLMNGLCNNDFSEHQSNYLIPYQASVWSQDAWVWKADNIKINGSNFELGMIGCDNYISTIIKQNGYHVINPSYFVCVNHNDYLSIRMTIYGISKGNVSRKNTKRIKSHDEYLFLQNIQDIPDKYTELIEHNYSNHKNGSKTQYTRFKKNIKEIILNEEQITASSYSGNYNKPVYSKFINESYWEPHQDDYEPYIEYNFSQIEELVVIDIQGKKVDRNDLMIGYVTDINIKYFFDNVWYEGGKYEGIKIDQGNYVKRIYLSEKIVCQKIRIYPISFKNICALQMRLYSLNSFHINNTDNIPKIKKEIWNNHTCFYYDYEWQDPTPTEKNVFQMFKKNKNLPYHYVAFPWSTLNDNKLKYDYHLCDIINNFNIEKDKTYFTVELHESFIYNIEFYKKLNIKYIFASQCTYELIEKFKKEHNIQIIPFSLHPTQKSGEMIFIPIQKRKYLANFVGLVISEHYISDIRKKIFENFKNKNDCYIKQRDKWHYNDVIYEGKDKSDSSYEIEYKEILMNSKFTLCPSGSGPNSIRLWEVLSFGSIPVILSDALVLPEIEEKWEDSIIIWKENDIENLYNYLSKIDDNILLTMSENGIKLYDKYFCEEKINQVILNFFLKNNLYK